MLKKNFLRGFKQENIVRGSSVDECSVFGAKVQYAEGKILLVMLMLLDLLHLTWMTWGMTLVGLKTLPIDDILKEFKWL